MGTLDSSAPRSSCSSHAFPAAGSFCDPTLQVLAPAAEGRRLSVQTEWRFSLSSPVSSQPPHWFGVHQRKPFFDPFPNNKICFKAVTYGYKDAQDGTGKLQYHMACEVEGATTNSKTYGTTDPRTWENHQHPCQQVRTFKSLTETC